MREIKFRCWIKPYYKFDKCKKYYRMIYPHLEKDDWYVIDCQSQTLMDGEGGKISDYKMYLQQFTGLKDKNGKDIYEGDIIKDGKDIGIIEFGWGEDNECYQESYGWCIRIPKWSDTGKERNDVKVIGGEYNKMFGNIEVIGNIFENKELLNK